MHIDRNEAIVRIRKALKTRTGKSWSVTGDRGTAWGWISVEAPPKRRVNHLPNPAYDTHWTTPEEAPWFDVEPKGGNPGWYTSIEECKELASAFGLDRPVHCQVLSISPDEREWHVSRVENGLKAIYNQNDKIIGIETPEGESLTLKPPIMTIENK